jgi:hypothetical protein
MNFSRRSLGGRTNCRPLVLHRNLRLTLIRNEDPHLPESEKKCEVTWCYNHQEHLTLFGSTPVTARNKLVDRPVGGTLLQAQSPDHPTPAGRRCKRKPFPKHARTSRTPRSIDMSLTRNRHARRLFVAATAGLVAASAMFASVAIAGGAASNNASLAHSVFSRGGEAGGQWQAVNRHAMRVDDVDNAAGGARPFVFQRVAAGSGLTPISAEVRGGARADQGAQLHGGGSIRADIARYNEERSSPRASGRQSDDSHSPANSPYRN